MKNNIFLSLLVALTLTNVACSSKKRIRDLEPSALPTPEVVSFLRQDGFFKADDGALKTDSKVESDVNVLDPRLEASQSEEMMVVRTFPGGGQYLAKKKFVIDEVRGDSVTRSIEVEEKLTSNGMSFKSQLLVSDTCKANGFKCSNFQRDLDPALSDSRSKVEQFLKSNACVFRKLEDVEKPVEKSGTYLTRTQREVQNARMVVRLEKGELNCGPEKFENVTSHEVLVLSLDSPSVVDLHKGAPRILLNQKVYIDSDGAKTLATEIDEVL